jgi:hypothetical protein
MTGLQRHPRLRGGEISDKTLRFFSPGAGLAALR